MEIDSTPEFSSISTINFSMESYDNFEQGIRERSCEGIVLSDSFMAKIEMTDDLCEDVFHYIYYRSVSSAMYKLRKESSTSTSQKTVKDEKRHDDLFNPAKVPSFLSLFQNKIACKDRSFSSCDEKYMAKDSCRNECNMLKIDKSSYSLSEKGVDLCKPSKILRKDALCDSTKQVVGQVSKFTDMYLEADMNEPLFCSSPSTIQQGSLMFMVYSSKDLKKRRLEISKQPNLSVICSRFPLGKKLFVKDLFSDLLFSLELIQNLQLFAKVYFSKISKSAKVIYICKR